MKKKSYFEKGDPFLSATLIILVLAALGAFFLLKNAEIGLVVG